ncbi:hypothetical protein KDL01_04360 [Actinospica durhamensis]|uniref:Uncharacterized protein n=1 Tax=Actinospica durhamensis TaxID=1508375 RepID=A0A941EJQ7_9ACTN|nr:hypothetical protein [Actinospica durhamensis]MBR7832476.1 hypothetical protein [Actinospica durhamensis]
MTSRRASAPAAAFAAGLALAGCSSSSATSNADTQTIVATTALPATVHSPSRPATSAAAVKAAPKPSSPAAPTVTTSDNPAFDLTGSGPDCVMTYGVTPDGRTLTVVTVTIPGEIITHVSDQAGDINRHDTHITPGPNAFVYDFPLSQATDMGAIFTPDGGASQSCTIEPAK